MIDLPENSRELIVDGKDIYLPNIAVDNVIFGYHGKQLKVLLQRPQAVSNWMLPGGYIKKAESAEAAAARVAQERTGLEEINLQQFKVFSKPGRNADGLITAQFLSQVSGLNIENDHWLLQRFISIGFYTLTDYTKVDAIGNFWMEECKWWDIASLPTLIHDHNEIIQEALTTLRAQIGHVSIGFLLLPAKFTLPEIRTLYETILGRELDDRNFSKKLLSTGIIEKLHEVKKVKGHRPPFLYRFKSDNNFNALKEGMAIT